MDFDDDARLGRGRVQDRRGRGSGGGRLAVGGGAGGIVVLLLALVLGVSPSDLTGGSGAAPAQSGSDLADTCKTGADANASADCQVLAVVDSVEEYWGTTLTGYTSTQTVLFTDSVSTGCGDATSAVGPFYCPADDTVYLDLEFFGALRTKFGAQGGEFAQAYVIAHEYGHHVQDLLGTTARVEASGDREGPTSDSVRLELQADCYAGTWANHAEQTRLVTDITDADIADGLDAAAVIGDDRIQEKFSGRVDRETWTHGSSEQRVRWFRAGYAAGDPAACDTFATRTL